MLVYFPDLNVKNNTYINIFSFIFRTNIKCLSFFDVGGFVKYDVTPTRLGYCH